MTIALSDLIATKLKRKSRAQKNEIGGVKETNWTICRSEINSEADSRSFSRYDTF